jgi:hypothetical protein
LINQTAFPNYEFIKLYLELYGVRKGYVRRGIDAEENAKKSALDFERRNIIE